MRLWRKGGGGGYGRREKLGEVHFGIQSMLSYNNIIIMECFLSVTTASQSDPVSFAEHSSDVCNQSFK